MRSELVIAYGVSVGRSNTATASVVEVCVTGDLSSETRWTGALVDAVIHLAARVHRVRADVNYCYAMHC